MEVKVKFNEINVKEEKEQTLVKVLMLKGDRGDPGSNDYNDLTNKPTKLSDFTNDGVFITNNTEDLTNYYRKSETYTQSETENLVANKVDKVTGKGLSTEDYTTTEKTKLSNIETEANKTTIVQSTGSSTTSVMSQNAVTTQLNGKVNVSDLPVIESGTFTPQLYCRADGGNPTNPTYITDYNYGKYKRIDNICFITFHLKVNITNKGSGYATVVSLPYESVNNVGGQALSIQELGGALKGANGVDDIVKGLGATIPDGTQQVNLEYNNGMTAMTWDIGDVWIGCTGFYFINES